MESLAYSIHLGSDKNKTGKAKEIAKSNLSETTSFSNNAIQNAKQLSKVNKHNLRDYDKNRDEIFVAWGTNNLYNDVQQLYLQEFEQSRLEYNAKQTREDRKIENYFKHISDSKLWDLACEFIIELGDMDFWENKDMEYKIKMVDVYSEQVKDLMQVVPEFKAANAVIHFDEASPHMHIVGIPVLDNNKRGMKKQVAKSKIFTKESLAKIQDEMRKRCIMTYNKVYQKTSELKKKQKGRNQDINVKDMADYKVFKKQYEKNIKKLEEVNTKTDKLKVQANEVNQMLEKLKPATFNKNNRVISNEDIEKIKNYTKAVKDTTKAIKSVNSLNILMKNMEQNYDDLRVENFFLKEQIESKDDRIGILEEKLSVKDRVISKLEDEKEKLKAELGKFKEFWHSVIKFFQAKIGFDKDKNYKYVADDLYKNGIFNDDEKEIVNDLYRNVKVKEDKIVKVVKDKVK